MPIAPDPAQREALLAQLQSITTLERGTLAEEYRERLALEGEGTVRLGPYYKHQCWEQGRNCSRRVPAAEVGALREDLQNGRRFDEAAAQLAEIAIAQGRAQRAATGGAAPPPDPSNAAAAVAAESKKNSTQRRARKDTARAKPSSRKSRRASHSKG